MTKDTTAGDISWEGSSWTHSNLPTKKYTKKELLDYRKTQVESIEKASKVFTKDFLKLCEIIKKLNIPCMVNTPYGEIHFLK